MASDESLCQAGSRPDGVRSGTFYARFRGVLGGGRAGTDRRPRAAAHLSAAWQGCRGVDRGGQGVP